MATNVATVASEVLKDAAFADQGKRRIESSFQSMPVLRTIRKQFIKTQPFAGVSIAVQFPVTSESASLILTLRDGGANPVIKDQNDEVSASLVRDYHVATGEADTPLAVQNHRIQAGPCAIATPFRFASGQTTLAAVERATELLLAGSTVVVSGYGTAGRDIAARARGMGAHVIVTEIDPIRALDAALEGFRVLGIAEASALGDLFIPATGNRNVIGRDHLEKLKGGAILCSAGSEIDLGALGRLASKQEPRGLVDEYTMRDGRKILVVTPGQTQSPSALDLHYATQALAAEYLLKNRESLQPGLHALPQPIASQVARLKLETLGAHLDRLTTEQEEYLAAQDTVK